MRFSLWQNVFYDEISDFSLFAILQRLCVAVAAAVVPFRAVVFDLHDAGGGKIRRISRNLARYKTYFTMSTLLQRRF